jgi:poly(A) polymerase
MPQYLGENSVKPKIYSSKEHDIDRCLIDPDALFILEKLRQSGFNAYLVGGSVRDLALKKIPKDFDISTSARPEQIKAIFQRRCILIGRRFRLAHIRFGNKIFEVSTFRSGDNASELIVHDNEWGNPEEDALRRDFTINGLFYDSSDESIIDFVDGWKDIKKNTLRVIGDPHMRFKQDPVRLLRLLKFNARFGFEIDPETEEAVHASREEITKSSPARILEEFLRMLESGHSSKFIQLLAQYGFLSLLFPALSNFLRTSRGKTVYHYLACADHIYQHKGKNVLDRSVLTAALIFPVLEKEIETQYLSKKLVPHIGDITLLTSSIVKDFLVHSFSQFPRRITGSVITLLVAQYRLTPLSGKRHYRERMFRHKEFELALNFLKLRALVNETVVDTYTSIRNQYRQFIHHDTKHHDSPSSRKRTEVIER